MREITWLQSPPSVSVGWTSNVTNETICSFQHENFAQFLNENFEQFLNERFEQFLNENFEQFLNERFAPFTYKNSLSNCIFLYSVAGKSNI